MYSVDRSTHVLLNRDRSNVCFMVAFKRILQNIALSLAKTE